MNLLMSSWNRSKASSITIASLMVVACASHPVNDEKTKAYMENWTEETLYSPNIESLRAKSSIFKSKESVDENPLEAQKQLKNFYCNKDQQIRRYTLLLKLVIPKLPDGISLEEANKNIIDYKKWAKDHIGDILRETANFENPVVSNIKAPIFRASQATAANMITVLKKEKSRCCARPQYFYTSPKESLFVHMTSVRQDYDYAYSDEYGIYEWSSRNYSEFPPKSQAGAIGETLGESPITFFDKTRLLVTGYGQETIKSPEDYVRRLSDVGKKDYPIYRVSHPISLEPYLMINGFTLLVPREVQEKLSWGRSKYNIENDYEQESQVFFGVKSNDEFSTEQALLDRQEIWKKYFQSFATVEEFPTKDPQIIQYEIKVDLNPFCKYARTINSLQTQ